MDLISQMTTFVHVVDGRSLSAAGRALGLSLPAVSRQLSALEADVGTPLVARSTRRLQVTEAGRRYYEHCQRVLGEIEEVRNELRGTRTVTGTLVVSASVTYGGIVVAPRLPALVQRHPRLTVDLRLEDRLADVVGEGVDVAIRAGSPPPDSTSIVAHPLERMHRVVVGSPRLLRRHGVPREPADLAPLPKLLQVALSGTAVRWALAREDASVTIDVASRLRSNAPATLRDLAVASAGLAYLPTWLVADDLAAGRLRRVLPAWTSPPIDAFALFRTSLRGAPRLRAFLEVLRDRA
jgi:DNA-binding transcriptional LysR family regulator